jgi:hypothetical protein
MAYTTINKSGDYFNTKLYTGNGSTQSITGVGFQPDFVWLKQRSSGVYYHRLQDSVRGAGKPIYSNRTDAEGDFGTGTTGSIRTFDTDGFSIGSDAGSNDNNVTMASWNWKANGAGSSNTDGSITSTVSANTTSGFSIGTYTGTGSNATIGHGLGATPSVIFVKKRNSSGDWNSFHNSLGNTGAMQLDHTGAFYTHSTIWNNTSPTSSVFSVGTWLYTNNSSDTYVFYAFAEKTGYSKFGSYTGNGNAEGPFIYTGFKPAFVITKSYSGYDGYWTTHDSTRNTSNVSTMAALWANSTDAESNAYGFDLLSNGFKIRETSATLNQSGASYLYMAFAEAPLVGTNGVTAKAR